MVVRVCPLLVTAGRPALSTRAISLYINKIGHIEEVAFDSIPTQRDNPDTRSGVANRACRWSEAIAKLWIPSRDAYGPRSHTKPRRVQLGVDRVSG
jgi:hypothetical protein